MKHTKFVVKRSLFDVLKTEVRHDISFIQSPYSPLPEMGVVRYVDSRTGRETTTSSGRFRAILSLLPGLDKRYVGPSWSACQISAGERERAAVVEFVEDNMRCEAYNEAYCPASWPDLVQIIRGEVKQLLYAELEENETNALTWSRIGMALVAGPGSSSGLSDYDAGSYSRMGNSPMTFSTEHARSIYKVVCRTSRLSATAEAVRTAVYGDLDSVDVPAKFCSVLKTYDKNRGICTQPSGNMTLQLSTHSWLCDVLKTWGVDLEIQQFLNRILAQYGSRGPLHCKGRSWSFCTWDLSRASNFPWSLIADLFPPRVVNWLDSIRSHYMQIEDPHDGETVCIRKEMCSTMGNGFTFALMTLLLSAIVRSLYAYFGLPEYDEILSPSQGINTPEGVRETRIKTWAVYGDDIIVDRRLRFALPLVLRYFGFLVNDQKSFSDGLFRESCGADYYGGYNVRPVFVETLDDQASIFSLLNRLQQWSIYHSVPLPRAIHWLRTKAKALGPEYRVPSDEDVSAGLHVPPQMAYGPEWFKTHFSGEAMPRPLRDLSAQGAKPYVALKPRLYTRRVFVEKTRKRWYCDVKTREKRYYTDVIEIKWNTKSASNPYAVLLHMLGGSIRQGQYGVRPWATSYTGEWRVSPNWGILQDPGVTAFGLRVEYTTSYMQYYNMLLLASLQRRKDASE